MKDVNQSQRKVLWEDHYKVQGQLFRIVLMNASHDFQAVRKKTKNGHSLFVKSLASTRTEPRLLRSILISLLDEMRNDKVL